MDCWGSLVNVLLCGFSRRPLGFADHWTAPQWDIMCILVKKPQRLTRSKSCWALMKTVSIGSQGYLLWSLYMWYNGLLNHDWTDFWQSWIVFFSLISSLNVSRDRWGCFPTVECVLTHEAGDGDMLLPLRFRFLVWQCEISFYSSR